MRGTTLNAEDMEYRGYDVHMKGREFWYMMLVLASNDDANAVRLDPSAGDDCLVCTTPHEEYVVLPPPAHVRFTYAAVGCDLISGSSFAGKLNRFASRLLGKRIAGSVTIQHKGLAHLWAGEYIYPSIKFRHVGISSQLLEFERVNAADTLTSSEA